MPKTLRTWCTVSLSPLRSKLRAFWRTGPAALLPSPADKPSRTIHEVPTAPPRPLALGIVICVITYYIEIRGFSLPQTE